MGLKIVRGFPQGCSGLQDVTMAKQSLQCLWVCSEQVTVKGCSPSSPARRGRPLVPVTVPLLMHCPLGMSSLHTTPSWVAHVLSSSHFPGKHFSNFFPKALTTAENNLHWGREGLWREKWNLRHTLETSTDFPQICFILKILENLSLYSFPTRQKKFKFVLVLKNQFIPQPHS
jgi:hypothetical protein